MNYEVFVSIYMHGLDYTLLIHTKN